MIVNPTNLPLFEPAVIVKSSSTRWRRYLANFLPPTYVLHYGVANEKGDQTTWVGTDNGDNTHLITLTPAVTDNLPAGDLEWFAFADDGTDRWDVGRGTIKVLPDLENEGADARSDVKKALDAVNAVMVGKARQDQLSYSIQGRSLQRMTPEELLAWRGSLMSMWRDEKAKRRKNMGRDGGRRIRVRFNGMV